MAEAKADSGAPIGPAELGRLFAPLLASRPPESLALAVSGGSDSTALMVLFAEWIARVGHPASAFTVLTVDHRLRPESGAEAAAVARQASALGFRHATLVWEGEKPRTGLQAAARAARYRLMAAYARAHGMRAILTAHTADDQAETLLMRLARGSGLDGLSAMAPIAPLPEDASGPDRLDIVRPLLDISKARLQAALRQRGVAWAEDPSNASSVFERPRLRAAGAELDKLGLTSGALGLSARRLQRARDALDAWTADILHPAKRIVTTHPCGFFRIDLPRLRKLPQEIIARVLARAVAAAGGSDEPVPLAGLEAILHELLPPDAVGAWTLAQAKLTATARHLLIEREPGREPLPTLRLSPGATTLWDRRFRVRAGSGLRTAVDVKPLGLDGVRAVRAQMEVASDIPPGALRALPAFWSADRLLAVPTLAFWADADAPCDLAATFIPAGDAARAASNLHAL